MEKIKWWKRMKTFKKALSIRGDSYYCPLSFQLDSYWNCEPRCADCFIRRLNRTWGEEQRMTNPEAVKKQLINGLKNPNPKTSLAFAIKQKKTIRFGNKADPYQDIEKKYNITRRLVQILNDLKWSYVIQTKNTKNVLRDLEYLKENKKNITIMPIISCGLEKDWKLLEHSKTTNPILRLEHLQFLSENGFNVGVNGEPFIPGYHSVKDFEITMKKLKKYGIKSYNIYNLHLNDWVAKELVQLGLDIEKIWIMNKDENWGKILPELIEIAKNNGIDLGCPDFVNSGKYQEKANTCCGITVSNPTTFNIIYWKKRYLKNKKESKVETAEKTWDNIGNFDLGLKILKGEKEDVYSLKDVKYKGSRQNRKEGGVLF